MFYKFGLNWLKYVLCTPSDPHDLMQWCWFTALKTWGYNCTIGNTPTKYLSFLPYVIYVSLSPLHFTCLLLLFVLIRCWDVSAWQSAKPSHGFHLAEGRVFHMMCLFCLPVKLLTQKYQLESSLVWISFLSLFRFWSQLGQRIFIKDKKIFNWSIFRCRKRIKTVEKLNESPSIHTVTTIH